MCVVVQNSGILVKKYVHELVLASIKVLIDEWCRSSSASEKASSF
jgi:hypothetical protein